MCGIFGTTASATNGFTNDEISAIQWLYYINKFRGMDSTGGAVVANHLKHGYRNVEVAKVVGPPEAMFSKKEIWDDHLRREAFKQGDAWIGHCRAATKGTVNIANAHPFEVKENGATQLVLVHNGTLEYQQPFAGIHNYSVDSEWLANTIYKEGAENVLASVNGAMALIWYDQKEDTLNFFRNEERPLHIAIGKGIMYLCSEHAPLAFIKSRYDLSFDYDQILSLNPRVHAWVKMGDLAGLRSIDDIESKEIPHKPLKAFSYNQAWKDKVVDFLGSEDAEGRAVLRRLRNGPNFVALPSPAVDKKYFPIIDKTIRNWECDIYRLSCGHITKVSWDKQGHMTTEWCVDGAEWTEQLTLAPYKEGLQEMSLTYSKDRIMTISHLAGNVHYTYEDKNTIRPGANDTDEVDLGMFPKDKNHNMSVFKDFSPGQTFKFKTTQGGKSVTHKGKSMKKSQAYRFEYYTNTLDGKITNEDAVVVEVSEVVEINKTHQGIPVYRAICVRNQQKVDSCMDFQFYTSEYTEQQIKDTLFFAGKIKSIRLTTQDECLETGAIVMVTIGDIFPCPNPVIVTTHVQMEDQTEPKPHALH